MATSGCAYSEEGDGASLPMNGTARNRRERGSAPLLLIAAISSGESEFYNIGKAFAVGLSLQSLCKDFKEDLPLRVCADATAGMGIANRLGLGRVRHLHTQYPWVQQKVTGKELTLTKEKVSENESDIMTKHVENSLMRKVVAKPGIRFQSGSAKSARKAFTG